MDNGPKREFLTVHDYGTGGIWMLISARSCFEIQEKWPGLTAFEDKPDWMSVPERESYRSKIIEAGFVWDIDEEPTGWLRSYSKGV